MPGMGKEQVVALAVERDVRAVALGRPGLWVSPSEGSPQ